MVYIVKGPCISCTWYGFGTSPCPSNVAISGFAFDAASIVSASIDFAGRGKVGGICGGADEYVTFTTNGTGRTFSATVDVWSAFLDGAWSSSTVLLVYAASTGVVSGSDVIFADGAGTFLNKNGAFQSTGACPTTLIATVTVLDNGTLSII